MYTQCPYCQTLFQINEEQLLTANGKAHCCRCDRIFNARENLHEPSPHGATPTSTVDSNTPLAADPLTDQQWSNATRPDELSPATGGECSEEEPSHTDEAAERILVSPPFEQSQHDDRYRGIPETELGTADEQQQPDLIPSLEIGPSIINADQERFSAYGEEEITGSIPELGDIDQADEDGAIPTFLLDPATPEETAPEDWESAPETALEPVFGAEFMRSQLNQEESAPPVPAPSDITGTIPTAPGHTDGIADPETSREVGELLQEKEESESDHSGHIRHEGVSEPSFSVPENTPVIEPAEDGSLYQDPEEILTTTGRGKRHNFAWSLAVLILLLLAAGQVTWLGRDRLINYPAGRELLDSFCRLTGCQLPVQRAPDQIKILNRSVASHPQTPNALQILLTLSNQAPFSQPYPEIQLSLFNTKDELLARRRFQPEAYLAQVAGSYPLLRPQRPVQLEILLLDPGEEATGFEFDFF